MVERKWASLISALSVRSLLGDDSLLHFWTALVRDVSLDIDLDTFSSLSLFQPFYTSLDLCIIRKITIPFDLVVSVEQEGLAAFTCV